MQALNALLWRFAVIAELSVPAGGMVTPVPSCSSQARRLDSNEDVRLGGDCLSLCHFCLSLCARCLHCWVENVRRSPASGQTSKVRLVNHHCHNTVRLQVGRF